MTKLRRCKGNMLSPIFERGIGSLKGLLYSKLQKVGTWFKDD